MYTYRINSVVEPELVGPKLFCGARSVTSNIGSSSGAVTCKIFLSFKFFAPFIKLLLPLRIIHYSRTFMLNF